MNTIISYPNAGRTWLGSMLTGLNIPITMTHVGALDTDVENIRKYLEAYPNKYKDDKLLVLVRELKDHIVSNYFQIKYRFKKYKYNSLSEFIRSPMGIEQLIKFNMIWLNFSGTDSKKVISYEKLSSDTKETVIDILNYFDAEQNSEEYIDKIIEYYNFQNMQSREAEKITKEYWYANTDTTEPEAFKTRQGVVGGYKNYMNSEDILFCDSVAKKYDYLDILNEQIST